MLEVFCIILLVLLMIFMSLTADISFDFSGRTILRRFVLCIMITLLAIGVRYLAFSPNISPLKLEPALIFWANIEPLTLLIICLALSASLWLIAKIFPVVWFFLVVIILDIMFTGNLLKALPTAGCVALILSAYEANLALATYLQLSWAKKAERIVNTPKIICITLTFTLSIFALVLPNILT